MTDLPSTSRTIPVPAELKRSNWEIDLCVVERGIMGWKRCSHKIRARRTGLSREQATAFSTAIAKSGERGTVVVSEDSVEWSMEWSTANFDRDYSDECIFTLMLTHLDSLVYAVSTGRTMDTAYLDRVAALAEHERLMRALDAGASVEEVYGYLALKGEGE